MSNVETVENQKIVIISKETADKDHPYSIINLEAIDKMASSLSTITSLKLWIYLAKNQNKFKFALSRVDFCRWANASKPSYLKAVNDLVDKGFLVAKDENSNVYTFYENPIDGEIVTEEDSQIEVPEEKKQEVKTFKF